MRGWRLLRSLDPGNRLVSDGIRGALAGGIVASFPASVVGALAATVSMRADLWWMPIALTLALGGCGVAVGAWLGWVYGIKARAAWLYGRYSRGSCRRCRYDLHRSTGDACPECGHRMRPAQRRYRQKRAGP